MRDVVRPGIVLFLITAFMAAVLAVAQEGAKAPTEANEKKAKEKAIAAVLPFSDEGLVYSDDFKTGEDDDAPSYVVVTRGGEILGVAVTTSASGYGGAVRVMTGIDANGAIRGVRVLSHNETPGLGANATKPIFYEKFTGIAGRFAEEPVKRTALSPNEQGLFEIEAMTSATITSRAVVKAVNAAIDTAEGVLKTGVGGDGR